MKYSYRILAVVCLMLFTVQCEVIDSDLLDDPNNVAPSNVDPNFLLNNIQLNARAVYAGASGNGGQMTRMNYMFGSTYPNAFSAQSFNGLYQNAYADLFIDVQNLLPIAEERQLFFHAGMAKVLKAYAMLTLADVFGPLPLEEALDPSNFNPATTTDQAIYDSALVLLDDAIADLENTNRRAFPDDDLFHGLNDALADNDVDENGEYVEAWVRAANTMKLKAALNTGDAATFNALVTADELITDEPDHKWDFTFDWGTNTTNPDSRHPTFSNNYVDQANAYMSVGYMDMLLNDKSVSDPRRRYYMYRQTTSNPTDVNLNTCLAANKPAHFATEDPFCYPGGTEEGWWGRDHLIDDGIPPDGDLRTTFGVYPVGGRFDANQGVATEPDQGYQGAGIDPILMGMYTHFMIAEGELVFNGDDVAARAALNTALESSFRTVRDFGDDAAGGTGFEIGADVTTGNSGQYIADVMDRWDNDTGNPGRTVPEYRLSLIATEYYMALWPNGLEAYNSMRRTGYPQDVDGLQPARTPNPGEWYRSFTYPANMVERNSSVDQKTTNHFRVFWDTRGNDDEFDF